MQVDATQLPARLQRSVQEYVALLQALAGERLLAVVLFGEAAGSGDRAPDSVQSVVVLDRLDLELVRALGAQGAALGKMGIQAPLLMTPSYIAGSLDVFPIELLDIQQRHLNLLGEDYFAPLEFRKPDVRLQLERELKRESLQIRQGILSAAGRESVLVDLYWAAAEQTTLLLRAVLWLHDKPVPEAPAVIVRSATEVCGVDMSGLDPAVDGARDIDFSALQSLYDSVTRLASYIDAIPV